MLLRDLFFRCLCGVTDNLIPEVSTQAILNAALNSAANINSGIEFSPPIASWLFILALLNAAFPCAVTKLVCRAQEYAGVLLRIILTLLLFRIVWIAFTNLLAIVMVEYLHLSRASWQWVSLLLLLASIASLIASLHTTGMIDPRHLLWKPQNRRSAYQRKAPLKRIDLLPDSSDMSMDEALPEPNMLRLGGIRHSVSGSLNAESEDDLLATEVVTKKYAKPLQSRPRPTRRYKRSSRTSVCSSDESLSSRSRSPSRNKCSIPRKTCTLTKPCSITSCTCSSSSECLSSSYRPNRDCCLPSQSTLRRPSRNTICSSMGRRKRTCNLFD